jgi:hypothetical protein
MKNKITCLLAGVALFGATANADIVLADGLSAYGYIDMVAFDTEGAARDADLTEYEIGLSFSPAESQWSAVAELSYDDGVSSFETVAVTYQHSAALSFSFGNIYTYQGLEGHDAPENDFISYAGTGSTDLYSADFAEGISADYSAGDITLGVWAEATGSADFEYYAAYTGIENLALAVAIADNDDNSETTNIMATYEMGDFTISAENVDTENALGVSTLDVTSVSVAYSMGDTTLAVRSVDGDYGAASYEKTSVAAFRALSDNVAVGVEYSDEELAGADTKGVAVELLYVF